MIDAFLKKLMFVRQLVLNEGRFEILSVRKAMLPIDSFIQLQELNPEKYYLIIKNTVKTDFERYAKMLNMNAEALQLKMKELLETYGIGTIQVADLNMQQKRAAINVLDSAIAINFIQNKRKATKPVCFLNTAIIAGAFTFLFGQDMNCQETKCITQGQKICEFIVK
jgi:predicted hydrocarbon binding protein